MTALHKGLIWESILLPQDKKTLPCKWVYKYKLTPNDGQPKYKANLVAEGFKRRDNALTLMKSFCQLSR